MFENLSYKKKLVTLIFLILVMGITAYKRSYRISIGAYKSLKSAQKKLEEVSDSQKRIIILKTEVDYLDNIIGKKAANADLVQQEIMNTYSLIEGNSELVKLEEIHKAKNDYFNIYSNRFIISGAFNELLKTTYAYEKEFEFSRVVSVRFYVDTESRTRKKRLFEQIIFQNYEKID